MLNGLFAGILAQYGMSEGQVETPDVETADVESAEVETADVETAEVETADVETAESVYERTRAEELEKVIIRMENREKALRDVGFVLLKLYDVPFEIIASIDNGDDVDVDAWIDKHEAEVNAMSFETVLYTESMFMCTQMGRMLSYESYNTRTGLKDYADCPYYVARVSELFNYDELMRNVIKTMASEYRDGISECFIG